MEVKNKVIGEFATVRNFRVLLGTLEKPMILGNRPVKVKGQRERERQHREEVQQLAIKLKAQEEEEERQRQAAALAAGAEKAAPKPGSWMENLGRKVAVKPESWNQKPMFGGSANMSDQLLENRGTDSRVGVVLAMRNKARVISKVGNVASTFMPWQGINKSPAMPIGGNPKKEKSGDDDDEDDEEACVRYDENGNIIKKDDEDESFVSLWGGVSLDASREFEFRSAGARDGRAAQTVKPAQVFLDERASALEGLRQRRMYTFNYLDSKTIHLSGNHSPYGRPRPRVLTKRERKARAAGEAYVPVEKRRGGLENEASENDNSDESSVSDTEDVCVQSTLASPLNKSQSLTEEVSVSLRELPGEEQTRFFRMKRNSE